MQNDDTNTLRTNIPTAKTGMSLPPDSKKDHRGGRPRKPDGEKKSSSYTAHANPIQSAMIEMKREQSGMKKSEFTLAALMSVKVVARLPNQVMKWLRDMAGMANNINQIAREANYRGYTFVHERLAKMASDIEELITFIRSYPEQEEPCQNDKNNKNDRKEDEA